MDNNNKINQIKDNNDDEQYKTVLQIVRRHYEQDQLNQEFQFVHPNSSNNGCRKFFNKATPNCDDISKYFLSVFPIFTWLSQYSIKKDFIPDIITGCTVAIMHIPQGMGYALLGNVPPIIGIYMAFFPVLLYVIFGTSRHNSMGTFAVITIMVGKIVDNYSNGQQIHNDDTSSFYNSTSITTTSVPSSIATSNSIQTSTGGPSIILTAAAAAATEIYNPIAIASAVCFVVGAIQLIMYVLRLGVFSSLLSESLVSGLTTGAAIHVLTSQIKDLFGLTLEKSPGYFEVINTYISIFHNISNINWIATGISAGTILILVFNNEILKDQLAKKCSFPVPAELILVLTGTLMSRFLSLETYSVTTLQHIPTGFPDFTPPSVELIEKVFLESLPIAVVSYTVSISMALIFAQKQNYEVNANQELFAMGIGNVFGSFFSCMPFSASLSRSTIQYTVGGKTQIASLVSCGILAIILLWIGPFFEPLPRCVLAGIIVVSLKGMLKQITQFFNFGKLSRKDAVVWLITFLTVVLIAIDIGLIVGLVLSLCTILIQGMKPYSCLLGHVPNTDLYLDINRYKSALEIPKMKIFHYCGSINFASKRTFANHLNSLLEIDLTKEIRKLKKMQQDAYAKSERIKFNVLILDFSALSYIDPSSVGLLKNLMNDFAKLSIFVGIAGVSCPVYDVMTKCGLREENNFKFKFFPTIHDAVHYADYQSIKFIDI